MRTVCSFLVSVLVASCGLLLHATLAHADPTPRAEPSSAAAEPSMPEPRVEGAARAGVMLPGEISPVNWFRTEAKTAPTFAIDAGFVVHRYFRIGPYLQLTPFSFDRMSGSQVIGSGSGIFLSGGVDARARLPISESFILRGGLTLGRNFVSYDGKTDGGTAFELSGGGFSAGAGVDAAWRAAAKFGAVAQFGFLSQIVGSADVKGPPTNATAEGTTRDFRFSPILFLTVGPEFYL